MFSYVLSKYLMNNNVYSPQSHNTDSWALQSLQKCNILKPLWVGQPFILKLLPALYSNACVCPALSKLACLCAYFRMFLLLWDE